MAEQSLAAFFAAQVAAVSRQEAPSTSTAGHTTAWSLPHTSSHLHLPTITSSPWTNTTLEPPHICGWVDHRPSDSYTCSGEATCLWDSSLRLVGCGHATSIDYFTSCIPYYDLKYCDSLCYGNPSIIKCASDTPHCVTPRIGPDQRYSILACEATKQPSAFHVNLFYEGQTTVGHLPRYLGENGIITYATHMPAIHAHQSSSQAWREMVSTSALQVILATTGSSSVEATGTSSILRKAAMVAGIVVAGLCLIGFIGFLLFLVMRYRKQAMAVRKRSDVSLEVIERPSEVVQEHSFPLEHSLQVH